MAKDWGGGVKLHAGKTPFIKLNQRGVSTDNKDFFAFAPASYFENKNKK